MADRRDQARREIVPIPGTPPAGFTTCDANSSQGAFSEFHRTGPFAFSADGTADIGMERGSPAVSCG